MAEPVYPSLEEEPKPIGFEALAQDTERQKVDDKRIKKAGSEQSEEIRLLTSEEQRGQRDSNEQDTVYFQDGERKIGEKRVVVFVDWIAQGLVPTDFVLTYKDKVDKKGSEEEIKKSSDRRKEKRETFFEKLERRGLQFEVQEPKYYDDETYFVKIHATFRALEKGAEDLLIRMPIKEVDLPRREKEWYRDLFSKINVRDPFEFFDPKVPEQFKHKDYFTAPYIRKNRADYVGSDDEKNFFSSAQRSAIVWYILENTQYGENEDQVGVSRLLQNNSFTSAYPLHDGDFTKKADAEIDNERQFLFYEWSHPKSFYKYQPLENIRHYFGEKVGLYFAWVGFYTTWLTWASIVGVLIMIIGLFTVSSRFNAPAREICNENLREFFYMCPLCDDTCDFWYYKSSCGFAHVSLLFDYGGTVFFAAFMACWAVLFLEFWKRTEAQLQYQWDTLGFEAAEQRERPEFVQAIKRKIKDYPEEKRKQYKVYNVVLERYEYIQPPQLLYPKVLLAFSILLTMVAAVLGIVFAVLIYRLAVSTAIYRAIESLPGGPSAADLLVSITGSCIQLIFIIIMNQVYERLATWLTSWELHRTSTEYEDSFTFKMYLFQFINFYSSIFYIAFFKGNFTGYPGGYLRIGAFRLDECSTYGCLMELTIQLTIIFVGKQVLNDITELGVPYAKTIIKKVMRYRKERGKEKEEDDSFVRWEKDYEQVPLSIHGLFFEYLELVIQYGFVTIFVAAFPLAPFFAWLNNVIEIRLDAHKFVTVFRRPVAERAQDIGAWFYLLRFVTNLCVVTNALLIAVTSQFIDREVYNYNSQYHTSAENECQARNITPTTDCGFVTWATSAFPLTNLLNGTDETGDPDQQTNFPVYRSQSLKKYENGDVVGSGDNRELYLPFIDFKCLREMTSMKNVSYFTVATYKDFYNNVTNRQFVLPTAGNGAADPITSNYGPCFIPSTTCRFRGQVDTNGEFPLEYWHVWTAKLSFIILFEHMIFILGAILDWLVPDVPQSVEDEIRREKLLAARLDAKAKDKSDTASPEPRERTETNLSYAEP